MFMAALFTARDPMYEFVHRWGPSSLASDQANQGLLASGEGLREVG